MLIYLMTVQNYSQFIFAWYRNRKYKLEKIILFIFFNDQILLKLFVSKSSTLTFPSTHHQNEKITRQPQKGNALAEINTLFDSPFFLIYPHILRFINELVRNFFTPCTYLRMYFQIFINLCGGWMSLNFIWNERRGKRPSSCVSLSASMKFAQCNVLLNPQEVDLLAWHRCHLAVTWTEGTIPWDRRTLLRPK